MTNLDAIPDFIVVGSGNTGAMAAQTLIERGARVTMIDGGNVDSVYRPLIPESDFLDLRRSDPAQHRYMLGDQLEGVPVGDVRVGAQLTPPRQFILRDIERWIPMLSDDFSPLESLAYGGLGCGWGLASYAYSRREMEAVGLIDEEMLAAYQVVLDRIGISAERDDGAPYSIRDLKNFDPPLNLDDNIASLYAAYERKRSALNAQGIFIGRSPMAFITRDRAGRKAYAYGDMEFWSDPGKSAYRPWITVDELKKNPKFEYIGQCVATKFADSGDHVELEVHRMDTGEIERFAARQLVLAAGALGSARIALRSLGRPGERVPMISNPYTYIPAFNPRRLGKPLPRYKTSLSQLIIYHDPRGDNFDVGTAHLYTYRSLLLFKLAKEAPLNFADGRAMMRLLQSSFVIAGMHHPEKAGPDKYLELIPDPQSPTGDAVKAVYKLSDAERRANIAREDAFCRAMRSLGCLPIRRMRLKAGSSIHYAGTLPYHIEDKPFTLAADGRLHGTRRVYVADGSGFRYLPAKGLTFSLMANAHRIACKIA